MPKTPDVRPKQILKRFSICKQYKIVDPVNLTFQFDKDIALSECIADGNFVITADELLSIKRAAKQAKECYDQTCKK